MLDEGKVSPLGERNKRKRLVALVFDLAAAALVAFALWKMVISPALVRPPIGPAPPVRLSLLSGGTFSVPRPGRVVFLDFWATWCLPCRLSLPLVENYARSHPDVDVIAVDVGEPEGSVRAFASEHGLSRVALDPRMEAADAFDVPGFPTIVVIDAHGAIRARWEGVNPAVAVAMERARRAYSLAPTSP